MLRLSQLSVNNFRSIRAETFDFPDFSILVGKNDVGKSNILDAIVLLLEGSPASIAPVDYYNSAEPIIFEGTFENVRAYLALCDAKNRSKIEERINSKDQIRLRRSTDEVQKLGKLEIYDLENDSFSKLPTGIEAPIKPLLPEVIFIGALDDVSEEVKTTKEGAVGKLMAQILARVKDRIQPHLNKAYAEASTLLNPQVTWNSPTSSVTIDNRLEELRDVEGRISHHLREIFPTASVGLRVNLPAVEDVFKSVDILIKDGAQADPYYRRGHGLQRALHLSLFRALALYLRQGAEKAVSRPFILLVEEPETCLHPDGQIKMRDALAEISKREQVLIATHSPILIAPHMIERTIRLEKRMVEGAPKPATRAHGPLETSQLNASEREIQKLFEIQRSAKFLFARGVLLVEGIGDEHLVAAAARVRSQFDFDSNEIVIVESGGKDKVVVFRSVLEKLGLKTWGLLDLDFLWSGAGEIFQRDADYSAFCNKLNQLVPPEIKPITDADKKADKRKKTEACQKELRGAVDQLAQRLTEKGFYVLRAGEIERYFGMSDSSKSQYLKYARAVLSGEQAVEPTDDFDRLFADLHAWSLSTRQ